MKDGPGTVIQDTFVMFPTGTVWRVVNHVRMVINVTSASTEIKAVEINCRTRRVQVHQHIVSHQTTTHYNRAGVKPTRLILLGKKTANVMAISAFIYNPVMF